MAFHVNEQRTLNITLGDNQINLGPGNYNPDPIPRKKDFNQGEVPFLSIKERKVPEFNPTSPYQIDNLTAKKLKEREFYRRNYSLDGEFNPKKIILKKPHFYKKVVKKEDPKPNPGPGAYYIDESNLKTKKVKEQISQKKFGFKIKKKQKKQLKNLMKKIQKNGPSIPDKKNVFGYIKKSGKIVFVLFR